VIEHAAALTLDIQLEDVPAAQVVAGEPQTGYIALGDLDGKEYGVWEMTAGAMSDVETDEVFVVIAGRGTVEFVDEGSTLSLYPGFVARLAAGSRTVWTITETLRKIYVA
jgi:uncharacterized cupin superfamily protein